MKKTMLFALLVLLFTFGSAGAVPIPFQVGTNGSLIETVTSGPGILASWDALGTGVFDLEEGETSGAINFFTIWTPLAKAKGSVEATIDLISPNPFGDVSNQGAFTVKAFLFWSDAGVIWGPPATIPYSYNGVSGGLLTLDLFDIAQTGWHTGTCYTISGTITNNVSPTPTPMPNAVLLLGTGLVGLAGFRRKFKYN
jgi:hypothetical protein